MSNKNNSMIEGEIVTSATVKKLFIQYMQFQINATGFAVTSEKDFADAVGFADLTANFVVQLLSKIKHITVLGQENGNN